MAASVRQFKYVDNTGTASTSWSGALDSNVLAGSLIVVAYQVYGSTTDPSSISDNLNGNHTKDAKSSQNTNSGSIVWLYSVPNSLAGACTVSFVGPAAFYQAACIMEITGAVTASPLDVVNSGTASGAPTSFTLTTTQDNDIIIAALGVYNDTSTIVAGSGLTVIQQDAVPVVGHKFATMKKEDAGTAGGNTITYTYSGGSTADSAMAAAAYKIPSTSPTPGVGAATLTGVAGRMDRGVFTRTTIKGQN